MSENLPPRLAAALAEAEEIERDPDRIARPDTIVSRAGHHELRIRLTDAEHAALVKIAGDQPASEVARAHLLKLMAPQTTA